MTWNKKVIGLLFTLMCLKLRDSNLIINMETIQICCLRKVHILEIVNMPS